jgi:beta-glucanase (GH16 family)
MTVDLTGYKLTFDDEFDQASISQGNGTVWSDIRPGSRMSPVADIGFGDSAFVDPASSINPFSLQNGALEITAVRAGSDTVGPGQWASGLISTQYSFAQEYGYFEMRAMLPTDTGVWPAFWMLPANQSWPPEIDVSEAYGGTDLYQTVHTGIYGNDTSQVTWSNQPTKTSGFHTYGVMWDPQYITFYFDGNVTGRQATPPDMHTPMYMLADLAMQDLPGVTDDPKHLYIDYIRAYSSQQTSQLTEVANDFFLDNSGASGPSLKMNGMDVWAGQFGSWTPIGAVQTASGYDVAWKNGSADQYTVWNTDGIGNFLSYIGVVSGSDYALQSLEPTFHQDLNSDGLIGPSTIGASDTLEVVSAYSGQVSFTASTGTLELLNSSSFAGTIAGMTGQNTIDFADIDPTKVHQPIYSPTGSGGTLTVHGRLSYRKCCIARELHGLDVRCLQRRPRRHQCRRSVRNGAKSNRSSGSASACMS